MKKITSLLIFIIIQANAFCQNQPYSVLDNLHPVTPTAFQFLKYSEMPISEYTGIPSINVPLYQVDLDGVKVPLNLMYHSVGIRVNQEASWVGLGWDLQIGSIVQQINDLDDFKSEDDNLHVPLQRVLPDYINNGMPTVYPVKKHYELNNDDYCAYNCDYSILPINSPSANYGFVIYTDNWVPINGVYDQNANLFGNNGGINIVDSEPDIFTANFLGHSIKFMVDWSYNNNHSGYKIVVLNKKGYSVTKIGDVWKIIVPSGEEYDFEVKSVVQTMTYTDLLMGAGSTSTLYEPSSNIWMLTRIITKNKKSIFFNYSSNVETATYPTFQEKKIISTPTGQFTGYLTQFPRVIYGTVTSNTGYNDGYSSTRIFSKESSVNLSSIVFPNGRIDFELSSRTDVLGGSKLDAISIYGDHLIKSYNFNYDYFDASTVGGNTYSTLGGAAFGNTSLYRLKLISVQENSGATYSFSYNNHLLPAKNSYAVDYWGFYNGQVANTSAVPNPAQFTASGGAFDWSFLGDSGDNHSANLTYARSCMLEAIKYPTGGTVHFDFELNNFDNYWVPDFSTSSNTSSSGNGLRIKSLTYLDANNTQIKKTNYSYSGGKSILPALYFRNYYTNLILPGSPSIYSQLTFTRSYSLSEINMNGFFSSNPFASINGVGYQQVTKTEVDFNELPLGSTVNNYYNNPDQVISSATTFSEQAITLPAIKQPNNPENGTLQSTCYYDNSNNLLKKILNTYSNINSSIYYGARVFGYDQMVRYRDGIHEPSTQSIKPRNMVGYYPIYDFETLLSGSTETDYYGGNSISVSKSYTYNQYNQLVKTTVTNSDQNQESTYFGYSSSATPSPIINDLISRNRLSDVVGFSKSYGSTGAYPYNLERSYKYKGNLIVPDKDIVTVHSSLSIPSYTTYDEYDTDNGNLLQYTVKGVPSSLVYDYNKEYVTAEIKNAKLNQVAYTSFESDGKGNWVFTGLSVPDDSSPTGKRAYNLINGQITASNLDNNKTYTVSYWSKSGPQLVNSVNPIKQGRSYKGWTYYEHAISGLSNGTVLVSGTGVIDELRLYPNDAQMTTYTYLPLIGTSSVSDIANNILYYEYDQSQRLKTVRNQDGHIIKSYCYNYAGQAMGCDVAVTTYQSVAKSGSYIKNDCGSGYTGSSVTYNVLANAYTSTISQEDADQKAQEDVNANGQAYVNAHGSCTVTPTTLYTRVEISNITVNVSGTGVTNNTTSTSGDVYIRLYSDAACTQHYTATANTTVLIAEGNNFSYAFGGGYSYTNNVSFTVASGTSELLVGNSLLSSYNTYEVESYGTFTDYYNYSYDAIVNTGSTYTPSTTVYN